MAYRAAPPGPASADVGDYEQQMMRRSRRWKIAIVAVMAGMALLGVGSCVGPAAYQATADAWERRTTKLTADEAKQIAVVLDGVEADAKKSQAAFDALWPRLRNSELGARRDLGKCRVTVPGPVIDRKDSSTSLENSSQSQGWTFVDLTPADARSPLEGLSMPQWRSVRTAPPDRAPTLESTKAADVTELRKRAAAPVRHDRHADLLRDAKRLARSLESIDVVVFVDLWANPRFSSEPPTAVKDLENLRRGSHPVRLFESGTAIARAFAWNPAKQELSCASQTASENSSDITFRSTDIAPLQQDLVLQLEKALQRSFVAVGDAPPRVERP